MTKQSVNSAVPLYFAILALCYAILPGAGGTELKGYAWECSDKKQLCFWHRAVVTPPKGWVEDDAWTRRNQALVLFENGGKGANTPIMYLRAHSGDNELSLEDYIAVAQSRWKNGASGSSIEPLPDFARKNRPSFKVFLYKNPSVPDQAFEITAFTKDVDAANTQETYFFQAVLSSPSLEEIERTKSAFYELLSNL